MALAETAQLVVDLKLNDQLSGGVARAKGELAGLEGQASAAASGGLTRLQTAAGGVGGALGHAADKLKGLALGVGIFGGLAAAGSITGFFTSAIDKVTTFGETVDRVSSISGQSVQTISGLAAALNYVGLGSEETIRAIAMAEKNLGNLAAQKDGVVKFEQAFGLSVREANGQLVDANTLLLRSADYFNNQHIPAATKAAALARLYGRNWQNLVEVFELGSPKIKAAQEQATKLGLTLTDQNMQDILRLRDATRDWGQALGGLQLQLGLLVIGPLTDLAKGATDFISDPTNRRSILGFFKEVISTAQGVGHFLAAEIIPAFQMIGSAAASAWGAIPDPLKDLIVKGFVADRTAKFLFGFSPIQFAEGALTKGLGGLLGSFFQRGGTPATPLFVADVTGGLGKGLGGGIPGAVAGAGEAAAGAAAGGTALGLSTLGIGLAAIIGAYLLPEIVKGEAAQPSVVQTGPMAGTTLPATGLTSIDALSQGNPALNRLITQNTQTVANTATTAQRLATVAANTKGAAASSDHMRSILATQAATQARTAAATDRTASATTAFRDRLARLNADENRNASTIRSAVTNQKPPQVRTTVNVNTSVSVTDIAGSTHRVSMHGGMGVWAGNRQSGSGHI